MIKRIVIVGSIVCSIVAYGEDASLPKSESEPEKASVNESLPESGLRTDGEVWNLGLTYYRDGDSTNALRVLRPLLLSKTHGARAAEVIADLAYKEARKPNVTDPLKSREEAAFAAQIAARANPGDGRVERNLTRALDGLKDLRETVRINKAIESAKGKDASAMLRSGVHEVREIMKEVLSIRTNEAAKVIERADSLSTKVEKLSEIWFAVNEAVCMSITNEEQQATIVQQIYEARTKTEKAAVEIADLSEEAYSTIADAEIDFTKFLKVTIAPPDAMQEDLLAQSNAMMKVEDINKRPWQNEAIDFTRAFRVRFPAWAKAYEEQSSTNTNMPPFSADVQSKISGLSTKLEKLQLDCCEKSDRAKEEEAIEIIKKILDLLPNQGGGGNQANKQNPPQNNNQQQEKQDSSGEKNEDEQNSQDQQDQQNGDDNNEKEEEGSEGKEDKGENPEDREVDSVLRKAQERSDEHEAEKRLRMRKAPLPPNSRDW